MLFPSLVGARLGYINLDALAADWLQNHGVEPTTPNPLIDPAICGEMIAEAHQSYAIDYSYGGWLEYRDTLLRGTYLDEGKKYLHLGIDINVPSGTPVAATAAGVVVRIDNDTPEEGGWGGRVIVKLDHHPVHIIFAHLATQTPVAVGDHIAPQTIIGVTGEPNENGGWFPHLHIQAVDNSHYDELLKNNLADLDGYGHLIDKNTLSKHFPDPLNFIALT